MKIMEDIGFGWSLWEEPAANLSYLSGPRNENPFHLRMFVQIFRMSLYGRGQTTTAVRMIPNISRSGSDTVVRRYTGMLNSSHLEKSV